MILSFHLIVWKNTTSLRIFLEFMIISFSELPPCLYKVQFIQTVTIKLKQVSFSHCFGILYFMLCKLRHFVFSPSLITKLHFATTSLCSQKVTSFFAETRDDLNKTLKR